MCPDELLANLEGNDQIVLRYETDDNPNGALGDVAAVCNATGNVMGLMPHPEHAVDPLLGSQDGARILGSLVDAARSGLPVGSAAQLHGPERHAARHDTLTGATP